MFTRFQGRSARWVVALALLPALATARVYYSKPQLANGSTGLFESEVDGYWYRGSGVVARDSRLIFSCAHVFFDSGVWATDYLFHRQWHAQSYPAAGKGVTPRGFHYFTSYSDAAATVGDESNRAFASDFTVFFGNSSFGPAMPVWPDGGLAVRSQRSKQIVGYPSDIDFTGVAGFCFQHSTGAFNTSAYRILGAYHEFDDVSTGPGNSGGPIFVRDDLGEEKLAGVLVSGWNRLAGVRTLDLASHTISGYALGLKDRTIPFANASRSLLPDGAYVSKAVTVSGFEGTLSSIRLHLSATTANRGALDVYLRSPSGKIRWIMKRSADTRDNVTIRGMDLSNSFSGVNPNGVWRLFLRDAAGGGRCYFDNCTLVVSAL